MNTSSPAIPFQVGDGVMFANRCQSSLGPMRVEGVDVNMFDARVKVDGKWWYPSCFISHEAWKQQYFKVTKADVFFE